jgi:hypothetical protein
MTGLLPDVVRGHGLFENCAACISGPAAMVRQTALLLAAHVAAPQIRYDPLPPGDAFTDAAAGEFRRSALYAQFTRPGDAGY